MVDNSKLFEVVTGTNLVNNGVNVTHGMVIEFRDAAAKERILSAFQSIFGYQPNAQLPTVDDFFNRCIMDNINSYVRSHYVQEAVTNVSANATVEINQELP